MGESELETLLFPILLQDRGDLDLVYDLKQFLSDPDIFFHPKHKTETAIDATGQIWSWKYFADCNVPDQILKKMDLSQCKMLLRKYFEGVRFNAKIEVEIEESDSIKNLFERLADFF
ncbi:MAG: hypothetical protein ABI373_02785 [Flavobacteriales bacterium]